MRKNYGMENYVNFTKKDLQILYQDEDFLIINKPAGLIVHQTLDKARINLYDLALDLINNKDLILHHRLDKDTSGAILFTKTKRVNKFVQDAFLNHSIIKTYRAIAHGSWTEEKGIMEDFLKKEKINNLELMKNVKSGGQKALTAFRRLDFKNDLSLMEFVLKTGRMHQIRVQSSLRNHPLLGDVLYGNSKLDEKFGAKRLYLHSYKLEFEYDGKLIKAIAPIPKEFVERVNFYE